jgi:ketosteroid isomerase-like protein
MMDDVEIVLRAISAVEDRRIDEVRALYHADVEFHWQPGLPYEGDHSGPAVATMDRTFADTWMPLRPDTETRRMDPRVVAATDGHVVVSYMWRAKDKRGDRFETETLAHYQVKEGKLRFARMYHFDLAGLLDFLDRAVS